jgi:hypothetical protein
LIKVSEQDSFIIAYGVTEEVMHSIAGKKLQLAPWEACRFVMTHDTTTRRTQSLGLMIMVWWSGQ